MTSSNVLVTVPDSSVRLLKMDHLRHALRISNTVTTTQKHHYPSQSERPLQYIPNELALKAPSCRKTSSMLSMLRIALASQAVPYRDVDQRRNATSGPNASPLVCVLLRRRASWATGTLQLLIYLKRPLEPSTILAATSLVLAAAFATASVNPTLDKEHVDIMSKRDGLEDPLLLECETTNSSETAAIKQRQNASSLVCSSPPEVLQYIFHIYVRDLRGDYKPEHGLPPAALLSHVCTRWRDACLDDHRLWNWIPHMIRGKWAFEFAARSGDSPLTILFHLEKGPNSPMSMTQLVLRVMHRIRSLWVTGDLDELQNFCDMLVDWPAPLLEDMHFSRFVAKMSDIVPGIAVTLPIGIFAHSAPRLRSVNLHRAQLAGVPVPAFAHVTTLSLGLCTADDILRLLQYTPHLQVLGCDEMVNPLSSLTSFPYGEHVNMPELRELRLRAITPTDIIKVFDALVAPSLQELWLRHMAVVPSDLPLYRSAVLRALSCHISTIRRILGHNDWALINTEENAIGCWFSGEEYARATRDDHRYFSPLYISWAGRHMDDVGIDTLFRNILGVLPMHEVHTLYLHDNMYRGDRSWACLHALPNVTLLECKMDEPEDVLDILQAMTPATHRLSIGRMPPQDERTLFPLLEKLVVVDMDISTPEGDIFLQILRNLVGSSRRSGKRLAVAFEGCKDSARVLRELKGAE
ncbi:hypothetical protein EVG20_g4573 [Dentipellis fragilis]|uniref:Uncharacterized protein n=1 Tax=Dentipellis fragilis TaxID=205917 RepID=A0A4Y9YXW3_9AGAM|nr:hypothetical protein EVG20_g4573 [Dentipellis fragilis]